MARPNKQGLDYFPFDVYFFNDEKIGAISGEFGIKGELACIKLLCAIYRNGYFALWNEMLRMKLIKELPGVSVELLNNIVSRLVRWDFFDKDLFEKSDILTSKGIQRRYFGIIKRRKNEDDLPYLLVNVYNNPNNVYKNTRSKGVNVYNNPQRKEKNININIDSDNTNLSYPDINLNISKKEKKEQTKVCKKEKQEADASFAPAGAGERINYQKLFDYFNSQFTGKLPNVRELTEKRKQAIKARIAAHGKEAVMSVFANIHKSPFLIGENDKNWRADFDWIFCPSNFVKILEGNFLKRESNIKKQAKKLNITDFDNSTKYDEF